MKAAAILQLTRDCSLVLRVVLDEFVVAKLKSIQSKLSKYKSIQWKKSQNLGLCGVSREGGGAPLAYAAQTGASSSATVRVCVP